MVQSRPPETLSLSFKTRYLPQFFTPPSQCPIPQSNKARKKREKIKTTTMAYMCADSGNLMAIAQQVIQQKQKQQQQQQQLQTQQNIPTASQSHPFSHPPPPWPHPFPEPTSFFLPGIDDDDNLFPLGHASAAVPFRLSSAFESDDWMEALISDSPTASNDTWRPTEPPLFDNSDLDRLINLTPAADFKDPVAAATFGDLDRESSISSPILKSLVDVTGLVDSDPDLAAKSLIRIRDLASDLGDPTERVAFYFSEALAHRLNSNGVKVEQKIRSCSSLINTSTEDFTLCYKSLNDVCPYFKFAHFTANQAILEATEDSDRIHIVDFGIVHGVQWAALLQALATRSSKKPAKIRISGVPSPDLGESPTNSLAATGTRLKNFANLLDLNFEFEPILTAVQELTPSTFRIESDEYVAVNFMLQLYNYLDDATPSSVKRILRVAKSLNPNVVTLGEYDVNLNRVLFSDRLTNALNYYSAIFESIEPGFDRGSADRVRVERFLFGHRILNAVGPDKGKRERMEKRENWAALMQSCGFETVPLSHYAVSQATILLRDYNYSKKYRLLDSLTGFLSLAWEERPLLTVSSWR